jgi:hypothetical protein
MNLGRMIYIIYLCSDMSTGYQIYDSAGAYYLTYQVVDWVDLPIGRQVFLHEKFIGISFWIIFKKIIVD